jgi:hypothetical protein
MRQTKSSPQADALMLARIKAVGIVQPPVVAPETDGGNVYIIDAGHRRVRLAIAAGLDEIDILVADAANDNGATHAMVENSVRSCSSRPPDPKALTAPRRFPRTRLAVSQACSTGPCFGWRQSFENRVESCNCPWRKIADVHAVVQRHF